MACGDISRLRKCAWALTAVVFCGCPETPSSPKAVNFGPSAISGTGTPQPSGRSDAIPKSDVTLEVADAAALHALLDKHRGKVVVVDFWATWCVPCLKSFPHTIEMAHKHQDQGLVAISVCMESADEKKQDALAKLKELEAGIVTNVISGIGDGDEAYEAFDIQALPTYKVFGRDGKLIQAFDNSDVDNPVSDADVEAAVLKGLGG
jgi:thiol-disulfide isomerase/thioredoxin